MPCCEKPLCLRTGGWVGLLVCLDVVVMRKLAVSTGNGRWVVQASTSFLSDCTDSFLPVLGTLNWQFFRLYKITSASSSPSVLVHTVGLCGQKINHWHVFYLHRTLQMQTHILSLSALNSKSVSTLKHLACVTDSDLMC
jgi:hypothetical protein